MQELKITDRFLPAWTILPFTIIILGILYYCYSLDIENNVKRNVWFGMIGVMYVAIMLVMTMKFEVVLSPTAIQHRFSFFGIKNKYNVLEKAKISQLCIRSVSALREFGGLGIRYNKGAKAYLTGGNYAIELHYNNRKLILGIPNKEEAEDFLKENGWMT
jgi:hypothetical protein